jgi:hypothetical protein
VICLPAQRVLLWAGGRSISPPARCPPVDHGGRQLRVSA